MSKTAVFTMKLETDLRAEFMAEVEASHRPASQVVRELMREFIQKRRDERAHTIFLERKVDRARGSMREGQGRTDASVEVVFAARRALVAQDR